MIFLPPTPPPADQDNVLDAMVLSDEDIVFFDNDEDINDRINLYSPDGCKTFECGDANCDGHVCIKHDCDSFKYSNFDDVPDKGDCGQLTEEP